MSQRPSISQAFKKVVQDAETAIIADTTIDWGTLPKKIHFMSGNILEIAARLTEMTASSNPAIKNGKYPLVALFKDIQKEQLTQGPLGIESSFQAKFAIITLNSNSNMRHDEREAKSFIPILIPIQEAILRAFTQSEQFGMPTLEQMKVRSTDCYFYGTSLNNKNQFNDYVDAIEIDSISLNIKNLIC